MRHVLSSAVCGLIGFVMWTGTSEGALATDLEVASWAHAGQPPLQALSELQQDRAVTNAQYGFSEDDKGTLVARHERAGLIVRIDSQGAHAEGTHGAKWSFGLRAFGCDDEPEPVGEGIVERDDQRILVRHVGVDEWYANGRRGFEQGFDVPEPPACAAERDRRLRFVLGSPGELRAEVIDWGVQMVDDKGNIRFGMGALNVMDSEGRSLPSRFEVIDKEVSLWVDARLARYPLRVR